MERETNLPPLHLPALNFLKVWHSALRCVCVHMCACACLRVCVWNPKNLNLRNEALYYENIPRCLWQRFLSAVDSSLLSKEWHRWEAVRFHSALATSLMSMKIWHSGCACVCVFMCPRVGVDAPVAVGMCMHSMPGEARGQYWLIPQGSFPCCWRPGLSLARNFTEEGEARLAGPQACFCHLFPAEVTGACHRLWQALYWLSPLLSPGVHF